VESGCTAPHPGHCTWLWGAVALVRKTIWQLVQRTVGMQPNPLACSMSRCKPFSRCIIARSVPVFAKTM
jgi:hypothetical protein